MASGQSWSKTWTFYEGDWHEGNLPIMGVRDHATWLCSSVFDGARTFEGVSPDLDLHCERVNASAQTMHLSPVVSTEKWLELVRDGIKRFDKEAALYIRPMYWAEHSGTLMIAPDPQSTKWCLSVYEAPMRKPEGFSITLSPYRKPSLECMPVNAQAGCLYPNNARADRVAGARLWQLCRPRSARQRRRACDGQYLHRQGWCCVHAGSERHISQWHYASARHQAAARRRDQRRRDHAELPRHPDRRRDIFVRQLFQGYAGEPHRGSITSAGTALSQGTRALLGIRACLSGRAALRSVLSDWG